VATIFRDEILTQNLTHFFQRIYLHDTTFYLLDICSLNKVKTLSHTKPQYNSNVRVVTYVLVNDHYQKNSFFDNGH